MGRLWSRLFGGTSLESLIRTLKDDNLDVRMETVKALEKRGEPAFQSVISALENENREQREGAAFALGKMGNKTAVPSLISLLKDRDWQVRSEAAMALGRIKDKTAVGPLISALKDRDTNVREWVIIALGELGDESAVEPLKEEFKDESLSVRLRIPFALGKIGNEKAILTLISNLNNEDWNIQEASLKALILLGKAAVFPIISALKEEEGQRRNWLVLALGEIGDKRAVPALKEALKDENQGVREAAKKALQNFYKPVADGKS